MNAVQPSIQPHRHHADAYSPTTAHGSSSPSGRTTAAHPTDRETIANDRNAIFLGIVDRHAGHPDHGCTPALYGAPKLTPPAGMHRQGAAGLLLLNAEFGKLVRDSSLTRMQNRSQQTSAVNKAMDQQRIEDADKAEKARLKAEKIKSIFGKVFKALTAVLTAASIVGAVFTGGATLVFTAALISVDLILTASVGNSLSGMVAGKVAEGVMLAVEKFSQLLERAGYAKEWAIAIATLYVSLAVVAAVVVAAKAGAAGAKLLEKPMKMLASKMPDLCKRFAATKLMNWSDKASLKACGSTIKNISDAGSIVVTVGNSGQMAAQKYYALETARIDARLNALQVNFDLVNDESAMLVDIGSRSEEWMQKMMASIGRVLNTQNDVNVNIIANVRAA